jgi:uncharacterized protein (UPF0210 family)
MQKTKESLIDNVHKKIIFMSRFLGHAKSLLRYEDEEEEKQVEEVKMLSDKINEPLIDIDKCSLSKLMNLLQKFANDPLMACRLHPVGNPKRKV